MATLIATVDVSKPIGADGKPVEQPINFSTGLSSHPGKFDVSFKARSETAARLLAEATRSIE
jgi:hypothetical protein